VPPSPTQPLTPSGDRPWQHRVSGKVDFRAPPQRGSFFGSGISDATKLRRAYSFLSSSLGWTCCCCCWTTSRVCSAAGGGAGTAARSEARRCSLARRCQTSAIAGSGLLGRNLARHFSAHLCEALILLRPAARHRWSAHDAAEPTTCPTFGNLDPARSQGLAGRRLTRASAAVRRWVTCWSALSGSGSQRESPTNNMSHQSFRAI
jgi:hypothetical protein